MEDLEKRLWTGVVESLCDDILTKRLWKPECQECDRYDHLEYTGCFLEKCKLNGEPTWIK